MVAVVRQFDDRQAGSRANGRRKMVGEGRGQARVTTKMLVVSVALQRVLAAVLHVARMRFGEDEGIVANLVLT